MYVCMNFQKIYPLNKPKSKSISIIYISLNFSKIGERRAGGEFTEGHTHTHLGSSSFRKELQEWTMAHRFSGVE